ncbi:MAG: carboxypeptidase regulatory-like domain-containing protein [Gemmatimonadaceae bacterium]
MILLQRIRLLLAASALLATATHARAQTVGAIHGTVVDQSGHPVENAQVALVPGSRSAITLDDGRFAILNIPGGVYTISVRRIGYEPGTLRVGVRDSTATVTVWLTANAAQLAAIRIQEKSTGLRYSAVVLDQNNIPVVGAEVAAMGVDDQLRTDSLGRFTVSRLDRGTLMLRIRKMGYSAYVNSFRVLAERADTIRMPRLAQSLSAVVVKERSGYGSDEMAYEELAQRARWKSPAAGIISREELAQQGDVNLCEAIPLTPSGTQRVPFSQRSCTFQTFRVLLNGMECQERKLSEFSADRVETIEYYPARPEVASIGRSAGPSVKGEYAPQKPGWAHGDNSAGTDVANNLTSHQCPPEVFVIWMRHQADTVTESRPVVEVPLSAAISNVPPTTLPPVETREAAPLRDPSYLQGQVVDSAGRPVRSAVIYTEDPLFATLSDKKGFFRISELPSGPMTIRAERTGFVPIEFQLRLPPDTTVGIGLKLMSAATQMGTMQIDSGPNVAPGRIVRVVAENGEPIMYANVVLEGATTRITNENGEINLGVGKREQFTLRVSRIGFAPWFGKVDFPAVATVTVTLPQIAQMLARVTVNGSPEIKTPLQLTGFYDRWMQRQKGVLSAVFIGPEELEFRHPGKITSMLRGLNGVQIQKLALKGAGMEDNLVAYATTSANVMEMCPMAVLIDGHQERPPVYLDRVLDANAVMGVEVYNRGANMPIGLQADDTACGVIAFWTGSRKP